MSELFDRWRWYIVALFAAPLLIASALLIDQETDDPRPLAFQSGPLPSSDIKVYVTGAVANPGVYALAEDLRWIDAIEAAGGATEDADLIAINLSRRALDEDHIIVPLIGGSDTAVAGAASEPLVNINTASQSELEALPGIGEVRASAIIQSRTVDGPFGAIEDLVSRELVPGSVFEDIAPLVSVY